MAENLSSKNEQNHDSFSQAAELQAALSNTTPERPTVPLPSAAFNKRRPLQMQELADQLKPIYQEGSQAEQEPDRQQIQKLTEQYGRRHPNELEAITILANMEPFFEVSQRINNRELKHEERKPLFKELTEYQYLWTHFVITNANKPQVLKDFWQAAGDIAESAGHNDLKRYQSGVITAAATYHVFETLDMHPQLSHPAEDAYDAIDLWVDDSNNPVQIKKGRGSEVAIEKTNDIEFPALEVAGGKGSQLRHFSIEQPEKDRLNFKMRVQEYAERVGRPMEGYLIRIPFEQVDPITGKPTPQLIEQVRLKLAAETSELDEAA